MSITAAIQAAAVDKPCEIARYTVAHEDRVLVARTIEGKLHVFDRPCGGVGRQYFVEAGFESDRELAVLLADYRREAKRLAACPMSRAAITRALLRSPAAEPLGV